MLVLIESFDEKDSGGKYSGVPEILETVWSVIFEA